MHLLIVTALALGCLAALVGIPLSAHRGKLHVPGYIGIALLTFVASFLFGLASGYRRIAGSPAAVVFSLLCFWSVAAGVGSIVAIFFCRGEAEA
jgi:hypothetical protein